MVNSFCNYYLKNYFSLHFKDFLAIPVDCLNLICFQDLKLVIIKVPDYKLFKAN
jgi:hypothetical protein